MHREEIEDTSKNITLEKKKMRRKFNKNLFHILIIALIDYHN